MIGKSLGQAELDQDIISPVRYARGEIETWDFIYDKELDYDEGCAVKYVVRHKHKNGAEDIKKAMLYLKHILKAQYQQDCEVKFK